MNYSIFWKTVENVRKRRDIRLMKIGKRRSYLASETNYHTTKWPLENLNQQNRDRNEQASLFVFVSSRYHQDSNVWVLVWLWKTKLWR